jgi:hypothetical protein
MVPVNVDTDGNLQVDILASLPAGSALLGDVQARNLGYIGAAWQKDPLRLGYSGQVLTQVVNTALSAGTNNLDTGAVPASRIWIVTGISFTLVGTVGAAAGYVSILQGATTYTVFSESHLTSAEYYDRTGWYVLVAGDKVRLTITGAIANDDAYLNVNGFYVDIAL